MKEWLNWPEEKHRVMALKLSFAALALAFVFWGTWALVAPPIPRVGSLGLGMGLKEWSLPFIYNRAWDIPLAFLVVFATYMVALGTVKVVPDPEKEIYIALGLIIGLVPGILSILFHFLYGGIVAGIALGVILNLLCAATAVVSLRERVSVSAGIGLSSGIVVGTIIGLAKGVLLGLIYGSVLTISYGWLLIIFFCLIQILRALREFWKSIWRRTSSWLAG